MASSYNPPGLPGLAGSTGTRVDSAAKHIMACKVDSNMLAGWCSDLQNAGNHMHIHKHKYCMTRDELVLNTNMALNENSSMMRRGAAYPSVVTTLGDCSDVCKNVITLLYHNSETGRDFLYIKNEGVEEMTNKLKSSTEQQQIKNLPFFMAQGYALGVAYASALSGDTVGSVLIGGMCTVMNGAFDCRAGQMLQWYFEFEEDMFYSSNQTGIMAGTRKDIISNDVMAEIIHDGDTSTELNTRLNRVKANQHTKKTQTDEQRKRYHDRGLKGATDGYPRGKSSCKSNMAFPKPYMLREDGTDHYGDKIRIFAKCITGARKHEMVDIMLMTQSL